MNPLLSFLETPGWTQLVQSLLHSLWQGALLALLLGLGLRTVSTRHPNLRYGLALLALAGLLLGNLVTWAVLGTKSTAARPQKTTSVVNFSAPATAASSASTTATIPPSPAGQFSGLSPAAESPTTPAPAWVKWLAGGWLLGCVLMFFRLLAQLVDLHRVRQRCRVVTDPLLTATVTRLQAALQWTRPILLLTGDHIRMPSVFGILYPKLLLPPALLTGIPVAQLEAILAHEIAHLRRHDFLVNLAQEILEVLFFFNPAVWWINRQIRHEREACCDHLAVAVTGQRETYAQSLAAWAERAYAEDFGLELSPAFAATPSGGPLDRLKRILRPGYRPLIRLPWYSLAGMLGVSGLVLFGLWQGTNLAVAKIMSPAERREKMTEIKRSFGDKYEDREANEKDDITIAGTVRMDDGSPLPFGMRVQGHTELPRYSSAHDLELKGARFSGTTHYGRIYFFAIGEGIAPFTLGPLEPAPGGTLTNVEIILTRGFETKVRLLDPSGNPLTNGTLKTSYPTSPSSGSPLEWKADAHGEIRLRLASTNLPLDFLAVAPGLPADSRKKLSLQPGQIYAWQLVDSPPVTGIVTARATGRPIAGATLELLRQRGAVSSDWISSHKERPQLAVSDASGRFTLRELSPRTQHALLVRAEGYAPALLQNVQIGQPELNVELGPEVVLSGIVTGDFSLLQQYPEPHLLRLSSMLVFEEGSDHTSSHSVGEYVPVTLRDGVGHFTVRGLAPGQKSLHGTGFVTNFSATVSQTNLVVHLERREKAGVTEREYVFRFHPVSGSLPASNQFTIRYSSWQGSSLLVQTRPLTNGEVRFTLPVPGNFQNFSSGLPGYWVEADGYLGTEAGSSPVVSNLMVLPAGVIYGTVTNDTGNTASFFHVSVIQEAKSPARANMGFLGIEAARDSNVRPGLDRFSVQPLPLGGTYRVYAQRGYSYTVSPPIVLTEKNPLVEIALRLPPGRTLTGKVTGPDGQPLPGIRVALHYSPIPSFTSGNQPLLTDDKGEFVFEDVNADAPGSYQLVVENVPGFLSLRQAVDFKQATQNLRLTAGEVVTGMVVDDATGWPIPGAACFMVSDDGKWRTYQPEGKTNDKGEFRFSNLEKGQYRLNCRDGQIVNRTDRDQTIHVEAGQKLPVTLRVKLHEGTQLAPRQPGR